MIITTEIIQRVKDETDILDLISPVVELKKNGTVWKGLCPFHNEKTSSFTVTPEKGIYFCFGCAATGDSIKWLQEHEGLTFPQAVKELAAKLNIHVEADDFKTLRPPKTKKKKYKDYTDLPDSIPIQKTQSSTVRLSKVNPDELIRMIARKRWNAATIAHLADNDYLGLSDDDKLLYYYPHGVKVRCDYDSSRGDRWLEGKAKGNLWRGNELNHELVNNVYVTEGETDLISLMSHRPEGITDAYIALPGSSNAKLTPIQAFHMAQGRKVFMLFDWDDAGKDAVIAMRDSLKAETDCEVYCLDWKKLDSEGLGLRVGTKDIGDLPPETIKKIDNYFKRL